MIVTYRRTPTGLALALHPNKVVEGQRDAEGAIRDTNLRQTGEGYSYIFTERSFGETPLSWGAKKKNISGETIHKHIRKHYGVSADVRSEYSYESDRSRMSNGLLI